MVLQPQITQLIPPVHERDHARGPLVAPVTLVEYGDYECPYCGVAHVCVDRMQALFGDRLCFVFRNFPLTTIHPHAEHAAEAAEAAGVQGKFWEMHDTLFENQHALSAPYLVAYAAGIGLDLRRFERDMEHHALAPRVVEDLQSGVRSGVAGTPSFFINGLRYEGPWDGPALQQALESAMK